MGTKGSIIIQGKYEAITLRIQSDAHPSEVVPLLEELKTRTFNNTGRLAEWIINGELNVFPSGRVSADIEYIYWVMFDTDKRVITDVYASEVDGIDTGDI